MISIFKKKTQEQKDAETELKCTCYIGYLDYISHPYVGFKVNRERISYKQFLSIQATNLKPSDCDLKIGNLRLTGYDYDWFVEEIRKEAPHTICVWREGFLFVDGKLFSWKELNLE